MLKVKVDGMNEFERFCSLSLDEISVKETGPEYDVKSDSFIGKVTLPGLPEDQDATKVLVFMLAGVTTRWKQMVAYFYTGNSVEGRLIGQQVKIVIEKAHEIGLNIINVTSDMASCNQAMWT
jgi:hypothetical protein